MKAILFQQYGSPDFLQLKEVKQPVPKDNEVLVRVHAVSINEWDWAILHGVPFVNRLAYGLFKPRMQILGADVAGRIEAVGKNVRRFQPGDEVFGDLCRSGWGGFAEYTCAHEKALVLKPASLTFEQAASLPQAGLLAVQGLRKGKLKQQSVHPAQKVLINGASGGVGTIAVQIAKSFGAEITGVCSTAKMEMVRSLGADHVIDYTKEDFTKNGQQYDLILDVKATHSVFDYKHALSPEGFYIIVGGESSVVNQLMLLGPWISMTSKKKLSLLLYKPNNALNYLIELVESGKVHPVVDKIYPLSETVDAFRYYSDGRARGKVVITVTHSAAT
jgi:NADPH:quinone reductase-like Zn-dependent oxidoreductase